MSLYELAYNLRMPAYIVSEMPYEEFVKWHLYFDQRPIGWREDERTYKLLQIQGLKDKPERVFHSLLKIRQGTESKEKKGNALLTNMQGSAMMLQLLNSTGGKKLEIFHGNPTEQSQGT